VVAVEHLARPSVRVGDVVTPRDGDVRFHLLRMRDSDEVRKRTALRMPDDDGPSLANPIAQSRVADAGQDPVGIEPLESEGRRLGLRESGTVGLPPDRSSGSATTRP
jgi:hypothetical protein